MNNQKLIQQYLPKELWNLAMEYSIDEKSIQEYHNLIVLILESKSLSQNSEKQSWFNLLPIMNTEQISKLNEILTKEKKKLEEINQKYQQKQEEINQKYQQKINSKTERENQIQTQTQLQEKENTYRQQELEEAENLLAQI